MICVKEMLESNYRLQKHFYHNIACVIQIGKRALAYERRLADWVCITEILVIYKALLFESVSAIVFFPLHTWRLSPTYMVIEDMVLMADLLVDNEIGTPPNNIFFNLNNNNKKSKNSKFK